MSLFVTFYLALNGGFPQVALVPEPSAALMSHFFNNRKLMEHTIKKQQHISGRTLVLVDIGGGTTDFTKVKARCQRKADKPSWSFDNVYTTGDNYLGGRDFTDCIDSKLKPKLSAQGINCDEFLDYEKSSLWNSAEKLKHQLSNSDLACTRFRFNRNSYKLTFSQSEFENAVKSLMVRFTNKLDKCVANDVIDEVLIVGGSSFCKFIKNTVCDYFSPFPYQASIKVVPDARDAVAIGAAYVGAIRSREYDLIKFVSCSSHCIGIELHDKSMKKLIKIGDSLPFCKLYDDLSNTSNTGIDINVFEGNDPKARNNNHLQSVHLKLDPPRKPGTAHLCLSVQLDPSGLFIIDAWCKENPSNKAVIKTHTCVDIGGVCKPEEHNKSALIDYHKYQIVTEIKNYIHDLTLKMRNSQLKKWNNISISSSLDKLQQDLKCIQQFHNKYEHKQEMIKTSTIQNTIATSSLWGNDRARIRLSCIILSIAIGPYEILDLTNDPPLPPPVSVTEAKSSDISKMEVDNTSINKDPTNHYTDSEKLPLKNTSNTTKNNKKRHINQSYDDSIPPSSKRKKQKVDNEGATTISPANTSSIPNE